MTRSKTQIWGGHLSATPDVLMVRFCAGRDVAPLPMADAELLRYDLWTNRAHAIMLHQQGVLETPLLTGILAALDDLEAEHASGAFSLDPALEDVHVNVERYVTGKAGAEAGGRLHTGRSRNDQVACDMRLYLRDALLEAGEAVFGLIGTLLEGAGAHAETLMPGFTHHQPAMITTWGHWLCAYAQALCRDLERISHAFTMVNRNPLGAGASFGTSWPLDRERTTELLAFERVDVNTLDCIGARWEHEAQAAFTYSGLMSHLATLSQDLILLSHPYWAMVSLPDAFVTGSSIMPQKRNPDMAEVIKGKAAWLVGMTAGLLAMPKGNMSGYNRDTQQTKYAIMDIVRECQPAPVLVQALMAGVKPDLERMRTLLGKGFLGAADFADVLARELGLPFRTCYDIAAVAVAKSGDAGSITRKAATEALREAGQDPQAAGTVLDALADPARVLSWRNHTGAPAPEAVRAQIKTLSAQAEALHRFIPQRRAEIEAAHQHCRDFRP